MSIVTNKNQTLTKKLSVLQLKAFFSLSYFIIFSTKPESVTSCVASFWILVVCIGKNTLKNNSSSVLFTLCRTSLWKILATLGVFSALDDVMVIILYGSPTNNFTVCNLFLFAGWGTISEMLSIRVTLKIWQFFLLFVTNWVVSREHVRRTRRGASKLGAV